MALVTCLLLPGSGAALRAQQEAYFVDVELSNASPLMTETVTLTYKLRYKGSSISLVNPRFDIQPPDFGPGFDVLRQGRSGGMDFDFSGSITVFSYAYILKPLRTGTYQLGPAEVVFNEERYRSKGVTIKVLEASAPPEISQADNIFIDASLSRASPYKGEEFILTYKLYSRYELLGIEEQTPPTVEGFSANLLSKDQQVRVKLEKINGQDFYTLDLYRAELYPLRSGEFRMDPFQMKVVANVPTGRRVRDFWGNRMEVRRESLNIKSPALKVNVRDLPASGMPENFQGAVGQFQLQTSLSALETSTGEPLTYRIQISGQGNLKLLGEPQLQLPPGFEAYDPQISSGANSRSYEYLLIPGKPGEFNLAPYGFSYFDPKQERYVELQGESYAIAVRPGEGGSGQQSSAGLTKEEIEKLGEDIRYLVTEAPAFEPPRAPLAGSVLFYTGWSAPLLLALPLLAMARRRREHLADHRTRRQRKARKAAEKRLRNARQHLASGQSKGFYSELLLALKSYLSDKYGLEPGSISKDTIRHCLEERAVEPAAISELLGLIERAEMALYAPMAASSLQQDWEAAAGLLVRLDSPQKASAP